MRRANHNHWLSAAIVAAGLVISWAASPVRAVIPPDPDNAALLYYQAFISLGDLDKETRDHIGEVARGTVAPNEKTREYIEKCRGAITLADAAKDLRVCQWGMRYSQGFEAVMPYLAQMRFLAHVLLADARVRALDGDSKGALERCLQMGTFARHIGDDTLISYLVGVAVQRTGYQCMDDIIGSAAKDAELLQWLKNKLVTAGGAGLSPATSLKIEMEIALDMMQMGKLDKLAAVLKDSEYPDMAKFVASADEPAMERARQLYSGYLTSALAILGGSKPYEQAHRELTASISGLEAKDLASAVVQFVMPGLASTLSARTSIEAQANATKAAVEICLKRAETGRLPEVLPAGLPKDPFSGQDFQYERTGTGFVLRCRAKDLSKDKTYEYAFTVK
jgi:hypothetical protein